MRIGEVSRQYHISVDNLYYYINYGLLVPPKPRDNIFLIKLCFRIWNGFWN